MMKIHSKLEIEKNFFNLTYKLYDISYLMGNAKNLLELKNAYGMI